MIYLVTTQSELFTNDVYTVIGIDKCLSLLYSMKIIQVDTETNGRDAQVNQLLCIQFGNDELDCRIVVDTSTIDVTKFKEILESKYLILQNAKFDLQFLFNYNIHPTKIYDTMIVEQLLYLGWGYNMTYNLRDIAYRRLNIDIDKTVRSQIIWRGLDTEVIQYAAGDVTYLEKIMWSQYEDLKQKGLVEAAKLECDFVSPLSYFEWCGIHLDENKWKSKMDNDQRCLEEAKKALDSYVVTNNSNTSFAEVDLQGDLFEGFNTEPKCIINWDSPKQVTAYFNYLGFDTKVQDKKTGEDKDSVLEKVLKGQKGIADDFLKLYFKYKEHAKVCSTYGQGHLNSINPNTGRIHTTFKQLGASSGRLSCGSRQENSDLARLKGIPAKYCTYPNLQQLPSDEITRSCFTAKEGNLFCSCDYSAKLNYSH